MPYGTSMELFINFLCTLVAEILRVAGLIMAFIILISAVVDPNEGLATALVVLAVLIWFWMLKNKKR